MNNLFALFSDVLWNINNTTVINYVLPKSYVSKIIKETVNRRERPELIITSFFNSWRHAINQFNTEQ